MVHLQGVHGEHFAVVGGEGGGESEDLGVDDGGEGEVEVFVDFLAFWGSDSEEEGSFIEEAFFGEDDGFTSVDFQFSVDPF